jgi:hypothetical protein
VVETVGIELAAHHAVIETSLLLGTSPENGNIRGLGWRLPVTCPPKTKKWERGVNEPRPKSPLLAPLLPFLGICQRRLDWLAEAAEIALRHSEVSVPGSQSNKITRGWTGLLLRTERCC